MKNTKYYNLICKAPEIEVPGKWNAYVGGIRKNVGKINQKKKTIRARTNEFTS